MKSHTIGAIDSPPIGGMFRGSLALRTYGDFELIVLNGTLLNVEGNPQVFIIQTERPCGIEFCLLKNSAEGEALDEIINNTDMVNNGDHELLVLEYLFKYVRDKKWLQSFLKSITELLVEQGMYKMKLKVLEAVS